MNKSLRPYMKIEGGHTLAWNVHSGCYGDFEGVVGCLKNVYGLFTFVRGNFTDLVGDVSPLAGKVSRLSGGPIRITGKVNRIYGDISGHVGKGFYGDVSHLSGCCTGVYGQATGKFGDLDSCGITDEDRAAGVDIEDLVAL